MLVSDAFYHEVYAVKRAKPQRPIKGGRLLKIFVPRGAILFDKLLLMFMVYVLRHRTEEGNRSFDRQVYGASFIHVHFGLTHLTKLHASVQTGVALAARTTTKDGERVPGRMWQRRYSLAVFRIVCMTYKSITV